MSNFKQSILLSAFIVGIGTSSAQSTPTRSSSSCVQAPVTETDLRKFKAVRQAEKDALGASFSSLQVIFQDIKNGNNPGFLQVTRALGEIGGSVGDARAAQKTALNEQNLSSARFRFLRGQINLALGIPSFDFNKVLAKLKSGDLSGLGNTVNTEADPQTKALIELQRTPLLETAPLGLVGL